MPQMKTNLNSLPHVLVVYCYIQSVVVDKRSQVETAFSKLCGVKVKAPLCDVSPHHPIRSECTPSSNVDKELTNQQ